MVSHLYSSFAQSSYVTTEKFHLGNMIELFLLAVQKNISEKAS